SSVRNSLDPPNVSCNGMSPACPDRPDSSGFRIRFPWKLLPGASDDHNQFHFCVAAPSVVSRLTAPVGLECVVALYSRPAQCCECTISIIVLVMLMSCPLWCRLGVVDDVTSVTVAEMRSRA